MQNPSDSQHPHPPIGGRFLVDPTRPLPGGGGGLPTFAATDLRSAGTDLMAVAVNRADPARANALRDLTEAGDNLLGPLGVGNAPGPNGVPAYYVICPAPPGPSLGTSTKPWSEAALIALVLRPVALVLCRLEARRVTHRSIRPNNVFIPGPGQPVSLGCAWAAPPALHQPPAYEPFYSLMCHPAARGDGSIADDVYALGCLLIALATGTAPMAGMDDATVLRRKLELGSFAALAGDRRLPPIIGDLARGMLAEDPDHRPTPSMLLDPAAARGRRVAARPPRRAPRPVTVGGTTAWDARGLAQAIGRDPESGVRALRDGSVAHWVRRGLGDAILCARIDDMVRQRVAEPHDDESLADTSLAMRVVATIEPLAPLCWRGVSFWPDGLGTLIAAATQGNSELLGHVEEVIETEAVGAWAVLREDRCDVFALRTEARANRSLLHVRSPAGGMLRLAYALNPHLPCGGALGAHFVSSLDGVAPAMEAIMEGAGMQGAGSQSAGHPFDAHAVGFIAARASRSLDIEVNALTAHHGPEFPAMPWLRILAQLQVRFVPRPLPALSRWVASQAEPLAARWRNRGRRSAVETRLRTLAEAGMFIPIIAELEDHPSLAADADGARAATETVARIDAELARLGGGAAGRGSMAAYYGQEIAAGLGLTALAAAVVSAVFG